MGRRQRILTIADGHGTLTPKKLKRLLRGRVIDAVFFLGDNYPKDIEAVLTVVPPQVPKLGVVGNHDMEDYLSRYGVTDLHGRTMSLFGYTIGGFEGAAKYRISKKRIMYTNKQSEKILGKMPCCDILLTHDRPRFQRWLLGNADHEICGVHSGLTGIGNYIRAHHPKYLFFGHYHVRFICFMFGTLMRCCFRAQIVYIKRK